MCARTLPAADEKGLSIIYLIKGYDSGGTDDTGPYHWVDNPLGTKGNLRYDEGEPFLDHGLDGVPGTGAYGEGTGTFVMSPNVENYFTHDPRTNIRWWDAEDQATTHMYFDGGVWDPLNFALTSGMVWGLLSALAPDDAAWFDDFVSLPRHDGAAVSSYDFAEIDWSAVPGNTFVRYGRLDASIRDICQGDGGHVGTMKQVMDRLLSHMAWLGEKWPSAPRNEVSISLQDTVFESSFHSPSLGSDRAYGIALPPDYHDPAGEQTTYPVLYFLHGYGMGPGDFLAYHVFFNEYFASGLLPRMIVAYGDGRCCFANQDTGERDCHITDGKSFSAPWRRECHRGSFYVNRAGYAPGDDTPYADSIFDLMRHVESTYRFSVPESARLD